jgi:hypothetical protein
MRVYGIDFTCNPSRRKPITCAVCDIDNGILRCEQVLTWSNKKFADFEKILVSEGPWIMGIDTAFGLAKKFIEENKWPKQWTGYIAIVNGMSKREFREFLDLYKQPRPVGDKEHKRVVDKRTGAMSPQNRRVNGIFYEATRRIVDSKTNIPLLRPLDKCNETIVETYPGHLARNILGRIGYRDSRVEEISFSQKELRARILQKLDWVIAPGSIIDDPTGDQLDALLCAVQAAWAWSKRDANYGIPSTADPLEGWIVDESLYEAAA